MFWKMDSSHKAMVLLLFFQHAFFSPQRLHEMKRFSYGLHKKPCAGRYKWGDWLCGWALWLQEGSLGIVWVPMPDICIVSTQTTFSYLCYGINTAHQKRGMCIGDNLEDSMVSVTSRKKSLLLISRSTHQTMLFASKSIYMDPAQVTAFTLPLSPNFHFSMFSLFAISHFHFKRYLFLSRE